MKLMMQWGTILLLAALAGGCMAPTPKFDYLGVPERDGRLSDADPATGGRARVTPVRDSSMGQYESLRMAGMAENVQTNEGYLYYTVRSSVPIADSFASTNPSEGRFVVTLERYKVKLVEGKK